MPLIKYINKAFGRRRKPSVEVHIPISPKPFFFNRIHYLAASIKKNAGELAKSKIVVTVGDDCEPYNIENQQPWSRTYNIEWRWLPREIYREHIYFATRLHRFTYSFDSDLVLLLDADTIFAGPIDEVLIKSFKEQKVLGVPANYSPVARESVNFTWEKLYELAGLGQVEYVMEHSGYGLTFSKQHCRYSPPYYNFGVLIVPRKLAIEIGKSIYNELKIVSKIENFFRGQMSTTLAMVRNKIPFETIPFKYNFVNDEVYLKKYAADFMDIRIMHFLLNRHIHKDHTFESQKSIEAMLNKKFEEQVNHRFQEIIRSLHKLVCQANGWNISGDSN